MCSAFGKVFQCSEDGVAEFLVEATRLKFERVEVNSGATTLKSNGFGLLHKGAAHPLAASGLRNDKELDVQPVIANLAVQTACDVAFSVEYLQHNMGKAGLWPSGFVELLQRHGDCHNIRLFRLFFEDDAVSQNMLLMRLLKVSLQSGGVRV